MLRPEQEEGSLGRSMLASLLHLLEGAPCQVKPQLKLSLLSQTPCALHSEIDGLLALGQALDEPQAARLAEMLFGAQLELDHAIQFVFGLKVGLVLILDSLESKIYNDWSLLKMHLAFHDKRYCCLLPRATPELEALSATATSCASNVRSVEERSKKIGLRKIGVVSNTLVQMEQPPAEVRPRENSTIINKIRVNESDFNLLAQEEEAFSKTACETAAGTLDGSKAACLF
jgi:hypothetical protein